MSGSNIPPPGACTGFIYTVQRGDTLFLIAQRFGISLDSIIAANPQIANPNNIFPGQQICVPAIIPTIECCMLLFRTANVPVLPEAEAGGVARIFQTPEGGNVLVSLLDYRLRKLLIGKFIAWIRRPAYHLFPFNCSRQLL